MEGSNVRRVLSQYEEQLALLMARVTTAVECNELRVQDQERREAISLEWKQLALVCDRCVRLVPKFIFSFRFSYIPFITVAIIY
jgi:hypothetical protein